MAGTTRQKLDLETQENQLQVMKHG